MSALVVAFAALAGADASATGRAARIEDQAIVRGQSGGVRVTFDTQGDENALSFSLTFDPSLLTYVQWSAGSGVGGAQIVVNDSQKAQGKLGVIIGLASGQTFASGTKELVIVSFSGAAGLEATTTPVGFGDQPALREVSDALANALAATWTDGTVTLSTVAGGPLYVTGAGEAGGLAGSYWHTDLEVHNPGATQATYTVALLKRGMSNPTPQAKPFVLDPGKSIRYVNALSAIFGYNGWGTLVVTPTQGRVTAAGHLYNSSVYNAKGTQGTAGGFLPALAEAGALRFGQVGRMILLSHSLDPNVGYQTHINVISATASNIHVDVDLYNAAGTFLGRKSKDLGPFMPYNWDQIYGTLSPPADVVDGYGTVQTTTPGGKFFAFALIRDSITGDPLFIVAE